MPKNNIVITYLHLHPSAETQSFVDSVIKEIYHELPPSSTIKATFSAKDDVVNGMLQVNSHNGPLFAKATSTNVSEIATKLLALTRRRVNKFKTQNHRRLSIKNLPVSGEEELDVTMSKVEAS